MEGRERGGRGPISSAGPGPPKHVKTALASLKSCSFIHFIHSYCSLNTPAVRLFLPRDAMRKRFLCCRRVSVCPSVCHVGGLYPHG